MSDEVTRPGHRMLRRPGFWQTIAPCGRWLAYLTYERRAWGLGLVCGSMFYGTTYLHLTAYFGPFLFGIARGAKEADDEAD